MSFDGVYSNVYQNLFTESMIETFKFKKSQNRKILFVMGKWVGQTNSFDAGQKIETLCTWEQIMELSFYCGFEVGYHGFSHLNLCSLTESEIRAEIAPPCPMKSFAYPYGRCDERVAKIVESMGYEEAWSVYEGDGSQFQKHRKYLNW